MRHRSQQFPLIVWEPCETHGSGEWTQRFAHPVPSLEATFAISNTRVSCGKQTADGIEAHFSRTAGKSSCCAMECSHKGHCWRLGGIKDQRREWAFAYRRIGLRTVAAWMPVHRYRTTRASAPTTGVYCPASPTPPGTRRNTAAGPGRPRTPASSAWQTPQKDAAHHGRSCAQSDSPGFSAY